MRLGKAGSRQFLSSESLLRMNTPESVLHKMELPISLLSVLWTVKDAREAWWQASASFSCL